MIELKIMKRLMGIVPLLNAINIGIIPEKCQGKIDLVKSKFVLIGKVEKKIYDLPQTHADKRR